MWGVWKMDESLDELQALFAGTTLYEQAMQRFKACPRRQEWLSVRLLLHHLLGEHREICYFPSGRPYLSDGTWQIGISHTKGYVAVILGHSSVGIDIEQYGERVRKIVPRFVREDEEIRMYADSDVWSLLLHWSAKETMFKCMDASEVDFRRHLFITPFTPQQAGTFQAKEFKTNRQYSFLIHYRLHPHFVLTWTVMQPFS